jgi:HK97 family phage major capsid protein
LGLTDPAAAGTLLIRPSEIRAGTPPPLLGMPLLISGKTPPLGSRGDLMLLDLSYYLVAQGYGPAVQASEHPRFTRNQTIIKAFQAVDGAGWLRAPYTLENGVDVCSPFVILA